MGRSWYGPNINLPVKHYKTPAPVKWSFMGRRGVARLTSKEWKKVMHESKYREKIERGYQPKCLKCEKNCKVMNASNFSNSKFICFDFKNKELMCQN